MFLEINDDKINKTKYFGEFHAQFFLVLLKKNICRTSENFAGPVDPRCYWSLGLRGQLYFELALMPVERSPIVI